MGWLEAIGSMALIPAISSRVLARCITESYIGEATDAASDDSASAEAGHAGANTPLGVSSLGSTVVPPTLGVESGRIVTGDSPLKTYDICLIDVGVLGMRFCSWPPLQSNQRRETAATTRAAGDEGCRAFEGSGDTGGRAAGNTWRHCDRLAGAVCTCFCSDT